MELFVTQPFSFHFYPEQNWLVCVGHVVLNVAHFVVDGQKGVLRLAAAQLHPVINKKKSLKSRIVWFVVFPKLLLLRFLYCVEQPFLEKHT